MEDIDWQHAVQCYEDEYYKCRDELDDLKKVISSQEEKIHNLEETIFLLTSILKELKSQGYDSCKN